jgi:hypothetical protein
MSALTVLEQLFVTPALNAAESMQKPGVTFESLGQIAGGLTLQEVLALPGAESALINLIGASIQAKLTSLVPATPATPAA